MEEQGQSKLSLPSSRVGRDYQLQEMQKQADGGDLPYGKVGAHPMLQRLARMTPYYKRNEARICTFYVKGACNRGQDCPFRHELPQGGELANQKLRDRFHGENDPLAAKYIRRAEEDMTPSAPEDKAITTLYMGGLDTAIKEKDIRDKLYIYGEIRSVKMIPKQSCAFITFVKREEAEEAMAKCYRVLKIKDKKVNLMWGRPQTTAQSQASAAIVTGAAGSGGASASGVPGDFGGGSVSRPYYPSMDPTAQGNAPLEGEMPDERSSAAGPRRLGAAATPARALERQCT